MDSRRWLFLGGLFTALIDGCTNRGIDNDEDAEGSADGTTTVGTSTGESTTGDTTASTSISSSSESDDTFPPVDTTCEDTYASFPVDVDATQVEGYGPGELLPSELCSEVCGVEYYDLLQCRIDDGTTDTDTGGAGDTGGEGGGSGSTGAGGSDSGSDTTVADPSTGGATIVVTCEITVFGCSEGGRRSAGLRSNGGCATDDPIAAYFASMAHSEAASVVTFVRLEAELRAHGAPADLLARIRSAARDEVRHARTMRRLARSRGTVAPRPRHVKVEPRTLAEIAHENAVEGCVAETWSALVCAWQARHCNTPEWAHALREIAQDETRHAELAWAIDRWLRDRLDSAARTSIDFARRAAAAAMVSAAAGPELPRGRALGLPSRRAAKTLAQGLHAALWA